MRVVLFILAILTLFAGLATDAMAKSAIHQILAAIWYVIATLLFIGAAIVDAIIGLPARLREALNEGQAKPTQNASGKEPGLTTETLDRLVSSGALKRRSEESNSLDGFRAADQFNQPRR